MNSELIINIFYQRTEYYEAVGSYSTLEQNPAPVTGGRVPNSPFFINTFSLVAMAKRKSQSDFLNNAINSSVHQGDGQFINVKTRKNMAKVNRILYWCGVGVSGLVFIYHLYPFFMYYSDTVNFEQIKKIKNIPEPNILWTILWGVFFLWLLPKKEKSKKQDEINNG